MKLVVLWPWVADWRARGLYTLRDSILKVCNYSPGMQILQHAETTPSFDHMNCDLLLYRSPTTSWECDHQFSELLHSTAVETSLLHNEQWIRCHTCGPPHNTLYSVHFWCLYQENYSHCEHNKDKLYAHTQYTSEPHVPSVSLELWWWKWIEWASTGQYASR